MPLPDDPLITLAAALVAGTLLGGLAKRARLPSVTGQILAGVLLGPALGIIDPHASEGLQPLTHFALALISVTVGSHLSVRRLRNAGRRLLYLLLFEAFLTPALVFFGLRLTGVDWPIALLIATIAVSTAPATVVALVSEARARGVFVKTLVAAVALNNIACVVLFELARAACRKSLDPSGDHSIAALLLEPAKQLLGAALLGGVLGVVVVFLGKRMMRTTELATLAMTSLLLVVALADPIGVSPLLTALFLGVAQANLSPNKDEFVESFFSTFQPAILAVFFTLAGLHLSFSHASSVAQMFFLAFSLRILGKVTAGSVSMWLAGATARVRNSLGLALVPQAGLAIGLVVLIEDDPIFEPIRETFVAVVLAVVTANEVVGPILTRAAIRRSGEQEKDRPRVLDFLQEENILTNVEASTYEEMVEQLTDLLVESHHLVGVDKTAFINGIVAREKVVSTCVGDGLAIPHGELGVEGPMVGVMGISRKGLAFDSLDRKPVHCVVLLATPAGERDRHLQVIAALARTFGHDPVIREALYEADTAAHAYELLHIEDESDVFNHYLDDDLET